VFALFKTMCVIIVIKKVRTQIQVLGRSAFSCNLPSGCYNTWEGVPHDFDDLVTSSLARSDE